MRISYSKGADAVYIELLEGVHARTIEIDEGTFVDLDAHGRVLGIEVLHPSRSWPLHLITERFEIPPDALEMIRDLWKLDNESGVRPFSEPAIVA